MPIISCPPKMKSIDNAIGFDEFHIHLKRFMGINNLAGIECVMHILNSFYFMSPDLNKAYHDNDTSEDKEATNAT